MADLRISSRLLCLGRVSLLTSYRLQTQCINDKVTAKDLVQYGVTLIDPGSIPSDKFDIEFPPGSITTGELEDGVTAIKLRTAAVSLVLLQLLVRALVSSQ